MMNIEASNPEVKQLEQLRTEVSALQKELEEANLVNQAMWTLLVDTSRRMQVSSAAIKAAVSSLLGYDIFWDGSTQHELLEIIDDSADKVSDQITLISLAFRSESKSLKIKPEPNEIQEILSSALDSIELSYPEIEFELDMLPEGNPVLVDYEYLLVSLRLLFEILAETSKIQKYYRINASEDESFWFVDIHGVQDDIVEYITTISLCTADEIEQDTRLLPTNKLKLLVMCRIFGLQSILISSTPELEKGIGLRLSIPLVMEE
jgi:signal transduction histidine kinase